MINIKIIESPKGILLPEGEFEKILKERDCIKRSLWLARAKRANAMMHIYAYNSAKFHKWVEVECKCRAKAERYR